LADGKALDEVPETVKITVAGAFAAAVYAKD